MSREEAAAIYSDNLMGYRAEYDEYQKTSEVLNDDDKGLGSHAVCGWIIDAAVDIRHPSILLNTINDIESQNQ